MKIVVRDTDKYDSGIHPEVIEINFQRRDVGDFFKDDRFPILADLCCSGNGLSLLELNCPSLQNLYCGGNRLTKLELNCPSLQYLYCGSNRLTKLELNCPSLQKLICPFNQLTNLELNFPSLRLLSCHNNRLTDLNGLEFCTELKNLYCSRSLKESADILRHHLPNLRIEYH